MNTNNQDAIKKIAKYVRSRVVSGVWGTEDEHGRGLPVAFEGTNPTGWIGPEEVERRIGRMKDDDERRRMQVRLGLGAYRHWASRDRQHAIDEDYDREPASQRGEHYRSPRPSRTSTDQLSERIAIALLDADRSEEAPRYDHERELYSRSIMLPPGNVGTVTEVHRRIIRSNIDGLRRIVVHQSEHWNSSAISDAHGMGAIDVRTLRQFRDERNGIVGKRFDLEVTFPELNAGDNPRELTWFRSRVVEPGWIPANGTFVFWSAPDTPTDCMIIEIKFGADALPLSVFSFADVYEGDRLAPDIPLRKVTVEGGAIRCVWPNPEVGRASGVRVSWPPASKE